MILLATGLFILSTACLVGGGVVVFLAHSGHTPEPDPLDPEAILVGGVAISVIGMFLLLCAGYIWQHP